MQNIQNALRDILKITNLDDSNEGKKLIARTLGNMLPTMSLEQIKAETLSTGAVEKACVYEATEDTVIIIDPDMNPDTQNSVLTDIKKGDRMIIGSCGDQSYLGVSYYLYGDSWGLIPNSHMMHVANPILDLVPDGYPQLG